MYVRIDDDEVARITREDLEWNLNYLEDALERNLSGLYSMNRDKNRKEIEKTIKAYKRVLEEYTVQ